LRYAQFLLKQPATLRKRQLMRYFAINFFHDGEVREMTYLPQETRLRLVLRSSAAVDCAWRTVRNRCRRRGRSEADARIEAGRLVNREDFVFQVDFIDVEALRVLTGLGGRANRLQVFWCGELRDATEPRMSSGTTWLAADFIDNCSLEVAFRTLRVVPLRPEAVRPYLVGRNACEQLLGGRSMRRALMARIAQWRDQLEQTTT
jgi:hypothetical protein